MKLLLLFLLIGSVILMDYFPEPARLQTNAVRLGGRHFARSPKTGEAYYEDCC
jgi:hypothetical protein